MKAGVFYGKEDLRIEERPVPQVGPGQMLVKIAYVGICGTDVELYKTGMTPPFSKMPLVLGHENCGEMCIRDRPIIDRVTWEKVQSLQTSRRRRPTVTQESSAFCGCLLYTSRCV